MPLTGKTGLKRILGPLRGAFAFYRRLWGHSAFRGNSRARVFSSVRGEQTRSWAQRAQEVNYFLMGEERGKGSFRGELPVWTPYLIL